MFGGTPYYFAGSNPDERQKGAETTYQELNSPPTKETGPRETDKFSSFFSTKTFLPFRIRSLLYGQSVEWAALGGVGFSWGSLGPVPGASCVESRAQGRRGSGTALLGGPVGVRIFRAPQRHKDSACKGDPLSKGKGEFETQT